MSNSDRLDQMIAVLQAAKAGKEIEFRCIGDTGWDECDSPFWDFDDFDYRAKPEPPREWIVWLDPHGVISQFGNHSGKGVARRIKVREVLE